MELSLSDVRAAAAAFTRIVSAHHREMARVAYVILGDADAAQDAVQSAWSIAWRRLASHREDASLRSWLLTIAANEARQQARRQRRQTLREIPVDTMGDELPGPAAVDRGLHLDLAAALGHLTADERALLALRFVAGLDSPEIARIQGGSASGVRTRLSRLLHRLREDLDHD